MLLVCYLLLFALLTTHLSPAAVGVEASAVASCLECPLEDGDGSGRGKLSFNPIIPVDEEYLKTIALASSPSLLGGVAGNGGLSSQQQQQKARFYHVVQQQQQHEKILAQQQQHQQPRIVPSSSSLITGISAAAPVLPSSNLLHVYALLNKGSAQEPRLVIDEYYLQDPGVPLSSSSRITKKAERGMLVDVLDYVSKPDDRNRRVGQNMRSSG